MNYGSSLSRRIRGRGMYRYAAGSATESSRLLVPEGGAKAADNIKSAPARLGELQSGYYDSMSPTSGLENQMGSYQGMDSTEGQSGSCNSAGSHVTSPKDDDSLIDFTSDTSPDGNKNITSKVS